MATSTLAAKTENAVLLIFLVPPGVNFFIAAPKEGSSKSLTVPAMVNVTPSMRLPNGGGGGYEGEGAGFHNAAYSVGSAGICFVTQVTFPLEPTTPMEAGFPRRVSKPNSDHEAFAVSQ